MQKITKENARTFAGWKVRNYDGMEGVIIGSGSNDTEEPGVIIGTDSYNAFRLDKELIDQEGIEIWDREALSRSPRGWFCDLDRLILLESPDGIPTGPNFPQQKQSQASTNDQLKALIPWASRLGLYDAADLLLQMTKGK